MSIRDEAIENHRAEIRYLMENNDEIRNALMRKTKAELVQMLLSQRAQLITSRMGYTNEMSDRMDEKRAHFSESAKLKGLLKKRRE